MAVGWALVFQRLLTVASFRLIRFCYVVGQRIKWNIDGTARRQRECTDPRHYERSVQVLDILMERHFCEMQNNNVEDFLCVHNRFDSPRFIVDNEHITLMTINDEYAVFCAAKDKCMRLWKTEYHSFLRMAQPPNSSQLILVPLSVFHRMAEDLGDPKGQLIFVFNTARCGSTLLTQMMEYTGRCVSLSEPESPNLVSTKYRIEGDTPAVRQLARDVIRWECRPYPSMQPPPVAYILKLVAPSAVALQLFMDLYPKSRSLFMYRDMIKNSKSIYRAGYSLPSLWLAIKFGRLSGALTEYMVNTMGLDGRDYHCRLRNDLELGIILNCLLMRIYLDLRSSGKLEVAAIRYEDLVANPAESFRRILEFCHLPAELVEPGLRGLEVDSQRNSPLAMSIIGGLPEPEVTPEVIARSNERLKKNGLPLVGEECLIEGTITYGKK